MSETTKQTCPSCGAALEGDESAAMCPACLMSRVLNPDVGEAPTISPSQAETISAPPLPRVLGSDGAFPRDLGGYTLVGLLGRGGMGTVYEAVDRATGRRLALKVLDQRLDSPEMRRRFLREGRLAARVNHPASLYVFGSEEIDGVPVITMEIAPGGTLQDAIDRRGPLPVTEAVDAVLSVIDGLEAALERGVLHRDIKPSNCFISPDGTVKVGDFGLSMSTLHTADSFVTQASKVVGTPAFAPPEQLRGDEVDVRSDIYAIGATLFALLTARAAFDGDNAVQIVASVIESPAPDASRFRDDLPAGLSRVIARCMAKEPVGRYADYASLRDALLSFSSLLPEPATQAQRTAAGWIDYLSAFLPTYAALMVTVGPERLFIEPLYKMTLSAWMWQLMVFGAGFLYFALAEGIWGAGLGKWIMNLRVVRADAGGRESRRPGIGRSLVRVAIPIALIEAIRIPLSLAMLPQGDWSSMQVLLFVGLSVVCPWAVALLWIPARRSNGFATAWDLATGTRVVVRPRSSRRPIGVAAEPAGGVSTGKRHLGLFTVTSEIKPGTWLAGEDSVLNRGVWLMRHEGGSGSEARRSVARPGRPRWLQTIEAEGKAWDAFEAARGAPLAERVAGGRVPWSELRYWLHDLAAELWASQHDGTLRPAYALDDVWITDDGRALLLDAPWPAAAPAQTEPIDVGTLEGQQRFLQSVADLVAPLTVPLHAWRTLENLRSGSFERLTFLTGTLRGLLNEPADVSRGLRAASLFVIPGYAWIATFLGIATNTDSQAEPLVWAGRSATAGLVMLNIIACFDIVLAFWSKSTGLSTFGLEAITRAGRASPGRMLARAACMWLPVVVPSAVLAGRALSAGAWIGFNEAAVVGAVTLIGATGLAVSALINPTRGLHDRIAGVWVGRR